MSHREAFAKVLNQGPCSTIQDSGRFGFKHLGIGQSGAADMLAYAWANRLLGNIPRAAALETTMGRLTLRFESATQVSVTGAQNHIQLNDKAISNWSSFDVQANDVLRLGFPSKGIYNYISVKGGFSVLPILSSCASSTRDAIGPFNGKPLEKNDRLIYQSKPRSPNMMNRGCAWHQIPNYSEELTLRFLPSSQFEHFSATDREKLLSCAYSVDPNSNKMGARLRGPELEYLGPSRMSQAVCLGTIQVPPSSLPMVLLTDHQTIGGYPKLGTVYASDAYALTQRRPGQLLRFEQGNLEEAQADLQLFQSTFEATNF